MLRSTFVGIITSPFRHKFSRHVFSPRQYFNMLSLTGEPTKNLVPPGQCQLTTDFQSLKLLERVDVSHTTSVVRFGLQDESKPLNLSTCACILAKADLPVEGKEGETEAVIRPYTPISTNALIGSFDLLIKVNTNLNVPCLKCLFYPVYLIEIFHLFFFCSAQRITVRVDACLPSFAPLLLGP